MKNFLIILLTKVLILILKIAGKNGGNLPGQFAYKKNENIFKYFKIDCPVIAVTATNGKTSTNNCIKYMIEKKVK